MVDELLGLFDFEKDRDLKRAKKVFCLDRVHEALGELGHPGRGQRIVHIAGTKDEGSSAIIRARLL
ncbi:MAG: hypothetical protein HQL31_11890, partial [Planctomycetes bacterium]|nr:hypothetical protein [Planctomycetota bacterium]